MSLPDYNDEYSNFCSHFLLGKQIIINTPPEESHESISTPKSTKQAQQTFKNHVLSVLDYKKNDSQKVTQHTNEIPNEAIKFSGSKFNFSKKSIDFSKLPPILNNILKMFINKIKRIGYLKAISES